MTDAPGQYLLPVDESPPPERLRWPMLLLAGAAVVLVHLALFTVFTPLAPEPVGDASSRADRATLFLSSRVTDADPFLLKMVGIYDPIAFLHPPESVGFSFFRTAQTETGSDAPFEPPLSAAPAAVSRTPLLSMPSVNRPLLPGVADAGLDGTAVAAAPAYPYWAADSDSVVFPSFQLNTSEERILRRQPPSKPSVFRVKPPVLPDLPREAALEESCGMDDLDLAARAWLDTLLNSSDCPSGLKDGGFCRVVWSAAALRREEDAQ
jgi:hypothetical protein